MIKFESIEQFRNVIKKVISNSQYMGKDENSESIFDKFAHYQKLNLLAK